MSDQRLSFDDTSEALVNRLCEMYDLKHVIVIVETKDGITQSTCNVDTCGELFHLLAIASSSLVSLTDEEEAENGDP